MKSGGEIKALTGLRGVGATWVFLAHLLEPYKLPIIREGSLAVPMFFVLSGFILLFVHENDFCAIPSKITLRKFFVSRIARVYPLHVFVLIILVLFTVLLPGFTERYRSGTFSFANFLACFLLIQTWGIGHLDIFKDASGAWNGPAWSLSAEIFYYITFPWLAFIIITVGKKGYAKSQVVLYSIFAVLIYTILDFGEQSFTRKMICGFNAFVLGMSIYTVSTDLDKIKAATLEFIALIIIFASMILDETNTGLFVIGVSILILALTKNDSYLSSVLASKLFHFLGNISFSLYLIHWPFVQFLNYIQFYGYFNNAMVLLAFRFLLMGFILFLSYLSYSKIEVSSRNFIRKQINNI